MNSPDFAALPVRFGWPAHCGMHASIFYILSITRMITQAGSLVYVRVENGHDRARKDISAPTDLFQQFLFLNGYGR